MKKLGSLILILVFSGCATHKAIFIPIKCKAQMPASPLHTKDTLENLKNISIYAQKLECTLDFCINGTQNLKQCQTKK